MKDVCVIFNKDSVILSFINEQGTLCFIEAETVEDLLKFDELIPN
jgi:hypothetical protein